MTPSSVHLSATADPRLDLFRAPDGPEVFHPIAHRHEVGRPDPFDVDSIHAQARAAFLALLERAAVQDGAGSGRMLLLLGEAGAGKTHLMRAFRNLAHGRGLGYCGYLQMTSATEHYGRYVLNNLVDALDQPYFDPRGPASGLSRLSAAVAESARAAAPDRLDQLRDAESEIGADALARLVDELADRVVMDDRYDRVDFDLIRALLYLQRDDPRIHGRVLKYLRCEDLSPADRRALGGLVPRGYGDAPEWVLEKLGGILRAVDQAGLVLLVDQLEDLYNMDEAPRRFRRAMATLRDLTDRVPSAVVVVACLEDFYESMRADLTRPVIDRLENDPPPIRLKGNRAADEIVRIVARRLTHLYRAGGVDLPDDDQPTCPIPVASLERLAGMRTRDVLSWCHDYREALRHGAPPPPAPTIAPTATPPLPSPTPLEPLWNDFLNGSTSAVPADDAGQLALLTWALNACSDELGPGHRVEARVDGLVAEAVGHAPDGQADRLMIGVCNKSAQNHGLKKQVVALELRAAAAHPPARPVVVRSTDFPSNPSTQIARELAAMTDRGGRRAVVADSDWRAMLALRAFRDRHADHPALVDWLRRERPLSQRRSIRDILALDTHGPPTS